ncbi:MAG: HAMP domain-containing protein [Pelatocladus maniniholoensis HA4357-MV3]|jgi:signal transduction histidine kinase|uniref:Circadian input-output histidine kinase CikA n=1 Tax=Pelatocladus maniniholoensis HA4357-MV3 TaxID=1117104 RepID=A0A9E3H8G1_9NOST|nr:HAMP domain-containing protein [Pelatocladus maniniholoensis HA4357-MV3]BAZ67383.1 integral membrane sensor signal transduction histidine kinase [Fischerella sp. NIES-4106]
MANQRQSSFRRILVSKILLLSVPVLLIGEIVAYQKARYSLLETARQNLTASAVLKGEKVADTISALKANLFTATQTQVIQSGTLAQKEDFINQLAQQQPRQIECIQLVDSNSDEISASTCGQEPVNQSNADFYSNGLEVKLLSPSNLNTTGNRDEQSKLKLLLSAPVYDQAGEWRYNLVFKSALLREKIKNKPGLLTGSTVVIAENGTILAHPIASRIGTNIAQHIDASRLQMIVKNAIAGKQDTLHLFFDKQGEELLAGYTAIDSPIIQGKQQKWVILAVTGLDNALYDLGQIKLILIVLTVGLIGASVLASLYLARCLALPVEELRDYALNLHSYHSTVPVPHNLKIREFNQLAQALDQMLERLKAWAEEVEIAWKEAKNANQSKSQFLAATSHELRNPLHIIINCIRLVRDDLCDDREEELEFLKRADETAIHLLGIINELLDISKIEAGKLSVSLEPIDLQKLLKEVINLQSVNIQQKGLQLNIPQQMSEFILVNADPAKLKQVLINIIGNATKFTDEGSITITTEIQQIDSKYQVIVSVQDTGVGIDPTQQQKLFRPFVMVDDATTRKFGGTGLGLAISRNLVELMGGKITLESRGINQGTTVSIILPLIDTRQETTEDEENGKVGELNCASQKPELSTDLCSAQQVCHPG